MDKVRQSAVPAPRTGDGSGAPSAAYIRYVLIILMLVNAAAYIDRSIITVLSQNDWRWLVGIMVIPFTLKAMHFAPTLAAYHRMTAPRMRATTVTLAFIFANTFGAGGGPFIAGFLSDVFSTGVFPGSFSVCRTRPAVVDTWCVSADAYGITAATICGSMFGVWSAIHFYLASRSVREDLI